MLSGGPGPMSTYFLCVRLCLNLTVPALGHEGQERKPRQTKGRALLRCSQVHRAGSWVGAWATPVLARTGADKMATATLYRVRWLVAAEAKSGVPHRAFGANSAILL